MAFDDWPGLTFQWYMGQSGDTSHPVQGDYRAPDRLTVYTTAYRPHPCWVRASLTCGAFHDSGTLTFSNNGCSAILFTPPPQSVSVAAGQSVSLSADTPFANPPASGYQWFKLEGNTPVAVVPAAFDQTYSFVPEKSGRYLVRVSNQCSGGPVTETVDSQVATVRVASCASITNVQWPVDAVVLKGQASTLQVSAESLAGSLTYTWYRGDLGDESQLVTTGPTLTAGVLDASTNFWVRIFNGSCYADSPTIHLTVCDPAHLITPESFLIDQIINPGGTARLGYQFAGTNIKYQWFIGELGDETKPIGNGADGILVALITDTMDFWVKGTAACGGVSVNSPRIRVSVRPQIRRQPVAALDPVMPGLTTTLTADGGTASASFQWYQVRTNDTPLAFGANSPTVTTPPITADTQFFLRISSGSAYVDTDAVTVHVCGPINVQWGTGTATNVAYDTHFSLVIFPPPNGSEIDFYRGVSGDVEHSTLLRRSAVNGFDANPITETTSYWVRVLNGSCWGDSTTRTVRLCIPAITQSPSSTLISQGAATTLSVIATPPANVTYQWYEGEKSDTSHPITGATAATRSVSPTVTTSYWVRVDGGCGSIADSEAAIITLCQPPAVANPVPSQTIVQGHSVSIYVTASGTNLSYQWYAGPAGNVAASVPTGPAAYAMTVSPNDTTSYWVRVTGTCGTMDSTAITVAVCATPAITVQPQSVSIFSGASTTLTVAATEATSSSVAYQWYRGNSGDVTTLAGSGTSFTTPALTSNTNYWVRVSCGICTPADSQTATVSMCAIPSTLPSPGDSYIAIGQTATLSTITGTGNSYAWYVGASGNTSQFAGYTTASMSIAPTVTTSYWCRVTNGNCVTATPAATVYVCIPTITQQPQSIMINPGASTTLSVAANTPGLTYQWYTGASGTTTSPLAGQTGSTLTVTPSSATSYWVRVMGSCNLPINSATATVSICQVPSVTVSQPTLSIVRGQTATISVNASGTNLSYQWYVGPAGNTAASYATGSSALAIQVTPQDTTSYWARVTGTCGTRDSSNIVVNVCAPPAITSQPQSVSVISGTTATLSVASSEATVTPVTYQWYRGNSGDTSTSVGTGTSFTTPAMTVQTNYWVRLSCGVCNPVDSNTATVSICPYPATLGSPGNVNIALGQTATLSTITGTGNSYAWYVGASGNTSQFAGYTTASISIAPTVTTSYWCRLTNGTCVSSTQTGTVSVCVPTFTQQPADVTILSGASTTLTSSANTAGVTYRWYTGAVGNTSSPVTNGTTASITVSPSSTTSYWVRATGSCGVATDSFAATVTICPAPVITTQPSNTVPVQPGGMPSFGVVVSGSNLTYQWYYGESGNTSSAIYGATGANYANSLYSTIRIWVRVSSQCGSVNSVAVWGSVYPHISQQPDENLNVGYNATASTTLAADGTYLHYAWKWGNVSVPGAADSPTLITPSVTSNTYAYCMVTSGIAVVQSNPTSLNLCYEGPYISSITKNATSITVSANGGYGTSYTWYQGTRGDISHQVGSYNWLSPSGPGTYWCRVYPGYFSSDPTCYSDSDAIVFP
jgi:Ig-like domain-containing protein